MEGPLAGVVAGDQPCLANGCILGLQLPEPRRFLAGNSGSSPVLASTRASVALSVAPLASPPR